jgi:hypothetical protein
MGIITDILKDIPLSAVLRERLSDQETKMTILEAENAALKTENLALKNENFDLNSLVKDLRQEIQRRDDVIQKEKSHNNLLNGAKMKWGCITFVGDNKLYCPSCFHTNSKKIETSRIDTHNRYCAVCKIKIPTG